jgi:hypothetical protein
MHIEFPHPAVMVIDFDDPQKAHLNHDELASYLRWQMNTALPKERRTIVDDYFGRIESEYYAR